MPDDLVDWAARGAFPNVDWDGPPDDEVADAVRERIREEVADSLARLEPELLRFYGFAPPLRRWDDGYHRPMIVE